MKIIGIDGGTVKIGVSCLILENLRIKYIKSWQIPLKGKYLHERLYYLGVKLEEIVNEMMPLNSMSIEETFLSSDTRQNNQGEMTFKFGKESPLKLSMARGVCYYIAGKYNLPIYEISNTKAKKLLTGNSIAPKNMVIRAANQKFGGPFQEDESCSLAVGHAHLINIIKDMNEAKKKN